MDFGGFSPLVSLEVLEPETPQSQAEEQKETICDEENVDHVAVLKHATVCEERASNLPSRRKPLEKEQVVPESHVAEMCLLLGAPAYTEGIAELVLLRCVRARSDRPLPPARLLSAMCVSIASKYADEKIISNEDLQQILQVRIDGRTRRDLEGYVLKTVAWFISELSPLHFAYHVLMALRRDGHFQQSTDFDKLIACCLEHVRFASRNSWCLRYAPSVIGTAAVKLALEGSCSGCSGAVLELAGSLGIPEQHVADVVRRLVDGDSPESVRYMHARQQAPRAGATLSPSVYGFSAIADEINQSGTEPAGGNTALVSRRRRRSSEDVAHPLPKMRRFFF